MCNMNVESKKSEAHKKKGRKAMNPVRVIMNDYCNFSFTSIYTLFRMKYSRRRSIQIIKHSIGEMDIECLNS